MPKRPLPRALPRPPPTLLLLLPPLLSLLYLHRPTPTPPPPPPPPLSLPLPPTLHPSPQTLHSFIHHSTAYILRAAHLGHHGPASFLYRPTLHPDTNLLSDTPDYNTLRHCGALYALSQVCPPPYKSSHSPHPNILQQHDDPHTLCNHVPYALLRGVKWLLNYTVDKVPGHNGYYGIWTHPEWSGSGNGNGRVEMKLGALGLGLVSMVAAERAEAGAVDGAVLDGVAHSITRLMRREDGGFWSYYVRNEGRVDRQREMRYYPGEAVLGLIRYGVLRGGEAVVGEAARGLRVMARGWQGVKCDHWGVIAVAELEKTGWRGEGWRELVEWGGRVVAVCDGLNRERLGSWGVRGAGFATALEAVVAMGPVLVREGVVERGVVEEMLCVVGRMLGRLVRVQWGVGEGGREVLEGAMPAAGMVVRTADGVVVQRREGFQIDCTQHSVSAAVGFVSAVADMGFDGRRCEALADIGGAGGLWED